MTLSKKKSRPITVDGVEYRWALLADEHLWPEYTIVAQFASGSGGKLIVSLDRDIPELDKTTDYGPITPEIVKSAILLGLESGWAPTVRSKDTKISVNRSGKSLVTVNQAPC